MVSWKDPCCPPHLLHLYRWPPPYQNILPPRCTPPAVSTLNVDADLDRCPDPGPCTDTVCLGACPGGAACLRGRLVSPCSTGQHIRAMVSSVHLLVLSSGQSRKRRAPADPKGSCVEGGCILPRRPPAFSKLSMQLEAVGRASTLSASPPEPPVPKPPPTSPGHLTRPWCAGDRW